MKYQVVESIAINSDAESVAALIKNLQRWPDWSPWLCLETTVTPQFNSDATRMSWQGDVIGEGELTKATETDASLLVNLVFLKPFKAKAQAKLEWQNNGDTTEVRWTMFGNLPWFLFFMKRMMQGMIRMDYRRGLTRMKAAAETGKVPVTLNATESKQSVPGFDFIGIRRKAVAYADIGEVMERDFAMVEEVLKINVNNENERYIAFYDETSLSNDTFDVCMGVAYSANTPEKPAGAEWEFREVPPHRVISSTIVGDYTYIGDAWANTMMRLRPLRLKQNKRVSPYEHYIKSSFDGVATEEYVTDIVVAVR